MRTVVLSLVCLSAFSAHAAQRSNPYACEGTVHDLGSRLSLQELRTEADARAALAEHLRATEPVRAGMLFCQAAELYKRLGSGRAETMYAQAIDTTPDEPAFELFFAKYYMLYRGAGLRPLFHQAETHLFGALAKLDALTGREPWDEMTADRLRRARLALYERDGVALAQRSTTGGTAGTPRGRPWLFLSPSFRFERATNDLDRTSDVRDRASEAAFSQSSARRGSPLSFEQLDGLNRIEKPLEGVVRVRLRAGPGIAADGWLAGRRTTDAQVTSFYEPGVFNDLKLTDFGASIDVPFAVSGNADAVAHFGYDRVRRTGLVEPEPDIDERVNQYLASGAFSQYLGPDRFNVSYVYVNQRIDATPERPPRSRTLSGGNVAYQIFRPLPLPGRDAETGFGRQFETRGIDVFAGVLLDEERYTTSPSDILVTRRDVFAGLIVRGLKRVDVTFQPTWFSSSVSDDASQDNAQLRQQGNVRVRLLDEERTAGMPIERFAGMPIVFAHLVMPFHWDTPRRGLDTFASRKLGAELWLKTITPGAGGTVLTVAGYAHQWFPELRRHVKLFRVGVSAGF